MRSPAHEIAQYLDDESVGTLAASSGWCISYGGEPTSPANAITVYDVGGEGPDTDQLNTLRADVQVRVRSFSYADAYSKQMEIRDKLLLELPVFVPDYGSVFVEIDAISDVISLGKDDEDRFLLTANYRTIRERT